MDDLAVIQVAARNRQANSIATLGRALGGADDVLAPPFGRTKALAKRQVAGLMELAGINLQNAAGGGCLLYTSPSPRDS